MDTWVVIGIAVGVLALVGIGTAYSAYQARRRREGLAATASDLGLTYSQIDSQNLMGQLSAFRFFNEGRARKVSNAIFGEAEGIELSVFDYQFTTGSGKHQHTHRTTIVAVMSQQLRLPSITMRPEHLFDALANLFGSRDIDFDGHAEFSKAFLLRSDNETVTRGLFDAKLLDFFGTRRGTYFEAAGNRFIFFRRGRLLNPDNLKETLAEGFEIHKLLVERVEEAWKLPAPDDAAKT